MFVKPFFLACGFNEPDNPQMDPKKRVLFLSRSLFDMEYCGKLQLQTKSIVTKSFRNDQ